MRARLGLLTDPEAENKGIGAGLSAWRDVLGAEHLLQPGRPASAAEFTIAMYGYLSRTPAALIGVSLADAVGDRRTQNVRGNRNEYPN